MKATTYIKRNDYPGVIYVSKESGKIYQLKPDGSELDLDNPLSGISLLLYRYVSENNAFKQWHLKAKK